MLVSDPNFVRGLSFTDVLILTSRTALFDTSYCIKRNIVQCFAQEYERFIHDFVGFDGCLLDTETKPKGRAKWSFHEGF